MKAVVLVSLISACAALPQLFLADTPEVQAEKQRFYQLYKAAADAAAAAPDINIFSQQPQHQQFQPQQPQFQPQQQQFQSSNNFHSFQQPSHVQPSHRFAPQPTLPSSQPKWTGPLAAEIPAGLPGSGPQVRNTPEVEAAIAEFTQAYNNAVVATRPKTNQVAGHTSFQSNNFHQAPVSRSQQSQAKWTGPFAATVPAGLPGSAPQVADTADVLAAKQGFNRAFQQQLMNVLG